MTPPTTAHPPRAAALLLLGLAACAKPVAPAAPAPEPVARPAADPARVAAAAGSVEDERLRRLLHDHWEHVLRASPELATHLGDRRYDDRLAERSVAAAEQDRRALRAFLSRAGAIDPARLTPADRRWRALFRAALSDELDAAVCAFEQWSFSPRFNPMADLFSVLDVQPVDDETAAARLLRRLEAFPPTVDQHLDALRAGLADGRVVNATSAQLVVEQVRRVVEQPTKDWPAASLGPDGGEGWRADWRTRLVATLNAEVRPALARYLEVLEAEILPAARGDEAPGLATVPDGEACYGARLRHYTTLDLDADTIHQRGLEALEGIHAEFRALGPSTVGTGDLSAIFEALRTDPALRFGSAEEIVAKAEVALARAQEAVPAWFDTLPETPCVVTEIPAHEAPYTTIAYYRQPNPDGSKPGEYFVNTHAPTTRPRHEAEVLAFHESVPGHHLQIARSYELPDVPAFHRYGGATAFVEGWALYTERLADEMGLYSSDVDRLGMLSFDAWRAGRLVVDTGLHAKGWSREEAVAFLLDNTPLAENNVVNEVDRYVTWPGQAVAYKTGQLHLRALRAEAEEALGEAFDVGAFHDVVLGQGAVSLPLLSEQVRDWVKEVRGRVDGGGETH